MHLRGAVVQVWTINDEQQMRRLWELGVDTVMTDDPATALAVARSLGLKKDA